MILCLTSLHLPSSCKFLLTVWTSPLDRKLRLRRQGFSVLSGDSNRRFCDSTSCETKQTKCKNWKPGTMVIGLYERQNESKGFLIIYYVCLTRYVTQTRKRTNQRGATVAASHPGKETVHSLVNQKQGFFSKSIKCSIQKLEQKLKHK